MNIYHGGPVSRKKLNQCLYWQNSSCSFSITKVSFSFSMMEESFYKMPKTTKKTKNESPLLCWIRLWARILFSFEDFLPRWCVHLIMFLPSIKSQPISSIFKDKRRAGQVLLTLCPASQYRAKGFKNLKTMEIRAPSPSHSFMSIKASCCPSVAVLKNSKPAISHIHSTEPNTKSVVSIFIQRTKRRKRLQDCSELYYLLYQIVNSYDCPVNQ